MVRPKVVALGGEERVAPPERRAVLVEALVQLAEARSGGDDGQVRRRPGGDRAEVGGDDTWPKVAATCGGATNHQSSTAKSAFIARGARAILGCIALTSGGVITYAGWPPAAA